MTIYNFRYQPPTTDAVKQAREKRRKVLEAARRVRRANYIRFYRKMQAQSQVTA